MFCPDFVEKKIIQRIIPTANEPNIAYRFHTANSDIFLSIVVVQGSSKFSNWELIAKIPGKTKANKEIIAHIAMTINIIG